MAAAAAAAGVSTTTGGGGATTASVDEKGDCIYIQDNGMKLLAEAQTVALQVNRLARE